MLAAACVLCSLSVIAIQPGPLSETLSVFWADKVLFLLNGFPVCVVLLLCWCATGDPFTAAGLGSLIVNLMSYVNLVKTDCRNDPFVPDDFQLLREAMNAASEYTLDLHWPILIAIVLGSAACFVLAHFIRARKPGGMSARRARSCCSAASAGPCRTCTRKPAFITSAAMR